MAKTEFQKNVDTMAAEVKQQEATAYKDRLEDMVGIVGDIVKKVEPGILDIDYIIDNVPSNAPLVSSLQKVRQVIQHQFMNDFLGAKEELRQLNGGAPDPSTEQQQSSDPATGSS